MGYTTDWKPTKAEAPDFKCSKCGSDEIEYREWEDSEGHEDYEYQCPCGNHWWAEGSDA